MTITLDGTTGITTPATITTGEFVTSVTGFKNRFINGAMVIDQKNAGASITQTTSRLTSVDRWQIYGTVASKFTAQQNAGAVALPAGFTNYLGITSSSAYSILSSDIYYLNQWIEGFNFFDMNWGTANAQAITLSFWVRSSLTGTFGGSCVNSAENRSYPFTYSIAAANTWEQKSITVPGDTSGTWIGATNGVGLKLFFGLGVGATYSGTAGAWAGALYLSATGATSVVGTNAATFYITGVQLEKGSTATSFDYRDYGRELMLCQRYFWRVDGFIGLTGVAAGSVYSATTTVRTYTKFPVAMRTAPTFSIAGTLTSSGGSTDNLISAIAATYAGNDSVLLDFTAAAGTVGQGKTVYVLNNASYGVNYIQATAEY
jgi:hypothetical protein